MAYFHKPVLWLRTQCLRILRLYEGFKLTVICAPIASCIVLLISGRRVNAIPSLAEFALSEWRWYVLYYWIDRPFQLVSTVVITVAVAWFDMLAPLFNSWEVPLPPLAFEKQLEKNLKRANRVAGATALVLLLLTIPLLHRFVPMWFGVLNTTLAAIATLLTYWSLVVAPGTRTQRTRLGKFSFVGPKSFDVGSMGGQATEIEVELKLYERIRGLSPVNARVEAFIESGEDKSIWGGMPNFYMRLSRLLNVTRSEITLHENTTRAIRHALAAIVNEDSHILYSDLEYGSIQEAINALCSETQRTLLQLRNGSIDITDGTQITRRLVEAARQWTKQKAAGKLIVLVSHICYETGARVDIVHLRKALDDECKGRVLLFVDGAQAVGNIAVSRECITACELYATSGHKWLLGRPTLGILVHNTQRIQKRKTIEKIKAGLRPFAYDEYNLDDYSKESIPLEPIVSLNAMLDEFERVGGKELEQHNRELASLFLSHVSRVRGVVPVGHAKSGIAIAQSDRASEIREALAEMQVSCQEFENKYLRFCFHYFHSETDVYRLLGQLSSIVQREPQASVKHALSRAGS